MTLFFRQVFNSNNYFWLGFIAGALFVWILLKSRTYFPALLKLVKRAFSSIRAHLTTGVETRYRLGVYRFAQRQHLTSSMFALDEISIEPMLMVHPPQVTLDNQTISIDSINTTIPYLPDFPDIGAIFQAPRITLVRALQKGANIALAGNPGSGKTVALAHLVSKLARNDPVITNLAGLLPIYLHAADIKYTADNPLLQATGKSVRTYNQQNISSTKIIELISDAVAPQIQSISLSRIIGILQSRLETNRALMIIDGLDELAPGQINAVNVFITDFIDQYPKIQIIAAVAFDNLAGLPSLGFQVVAMAAWGDKEKWEFIQKWGTFWNKLNSNNKQTKVQWDEHQYFSSWLNADQMPTSPFDMTLKTWGIYAGDLLGSDSSSAIDAYLRRITSAQSRSWDVLERLAFQMVDEMEPALQLRWSDTIPIGVDRNQAPTIDREITHKTKLRMKRVKIHQLPEYLVDSGLLYEHTNSRFRFANPILTGYLAGKALKSYNGLNRIQEQPTWSGKSTTLYYWAHFGDASSVVQYLLKQDIFLRDQLVGVARWLRMIPINQPWRSFIFRALVSALNIEKDTYTLASRIMASLAISGDPGVALLFRQMLRSENISLRHLAALGCGIIKDTKAINDLSNLLKDKSPYIARAASLALVAIGDKSALEIIADSLLHGTEITRRAAAEALANHPEEGFPALKDGSTHDDLRVRHAAIYGLVRIQEPWAIDIIKQMQIEDKEWIVRNAAIQAMEEISQAETNIPTPFPYLSDTPWLVDYAAKQGIGVAPGKPAYELVIDVLRNGSVDEKLHALNYLAMFGDESAIPVIYSWYFGSSGEIRDTAYQTLWLLSKAGVPLPPPQKFGFEAPVVNK